MHQAAVEDGQVPAAKLIDFRMLESGKAFALKIRVGGIMKSKLLAAVLLAGSSLFAAPAVVVDVGIGPPAARVAVLSAAPGPGYTWVGGYWYPSGPRWAWHAGYWARPPYGYARWVGPRYYGHHYYRGYWRR